MRKINTSNITPSIGMPVKSGTIDLIFDSVKECSSAEIISKIRNSGYTYNPAVPYILGGINYTTLGGLGTTFTEGFVFFNGEVLYCPSQTVLGAPNPGVVVADIETVNITGTNADPVQFFGTGAGSYNVHENRRVKLRGGPSPTLAAYTAFVRLGIAITSTPAQYQAISFKNDIINLDDVLLTYPPYSFSYNFIDARVGATTTIYLGLPSSGTTFTFPNTVGTAVSLLNGRVNGFSLGSGSISRAVIEFKYIGKDSYNSNVVIVNAYTAA